MYGAKGSKSRKIPVYNPFPKPTDVKPDIHPDSRSDTGTVREGKEEHIEFDPDGRYILFVYRADGSAIFRSDPLRKPHHHELPRFAEDPISKGLRQPILTSWGIGTAFTMEPYRIETSSHTICVCRVKTNHGVIERNLEFIGMKNYFQGHPYDEVAYRTIFIVSLYASEDDKAIDFERFSAQIQQTCFLKPELLHEFIAGASLSEIKEKEKQQQPIRAVPNKSIIDTSVVNPAAITKQEKKSKVPAFEQTVFQEVPDVFSKTHPIFRVRLVFQRRFNGWLIRLTSGNEVLQGEGVSPDAAYADMIRKKSFSNLAKAKELRSWIQEEMINMKKPAVTSIKRLVSNDFSLLEDDLKDDLYKNRPVVCYSDFSGRIQFGTMIKGQIIHIINTRLLDYANYQLLENWLMSTRVTKLTCGKDLAFNFPKSESVLDVQTFIANGQAEASELSTITDATAELDGDVTAMVEWVVYLNKFVQTWESSI